MKIRQRTLVNNLMVGLIPLLLLTIIMSLVNYKRDSQYIKQRLLNYILQFKEDLDRTLEKYRDFSYFISHQEVKLIRENGNWTIRESERGPLLVNRYNLRIYEIFLKNQSVHQNIYDSKDKMFLIGPQMADLIWSRLNQPIHTRVFNSSFTSLVSNIIVFHNCSILTDPVNEKKIGFSAISTPLDREYFDDYFVHDSMVIYFIQSSKGLFFSENIMPDQNTDIQITDMFRQNPRGYHLININNKKYYILRDAFVTLTGGDMSTTPQSQTYVGAMIDSSLLNRELSQFQIAALSSLLVSVVLLIFIAAAYSRKLTRPISNLQEQIRMFDKYQEPMFAPRVKSNDEINDLHKSFSKMSAHILIKNAEIENEKNKLNQQNQTMLAELEIARGIQASLLPQTSPNRQISYFYRPMLQVGGDYFDFIDLPAGKIGFFISDVSGHGVPAALITAMLKSFILQNRKIADSPSLFLYHLNQFLFNQTGGNFVTVLYGVFDPYLLEFTYANAGHHHPMILRGDAIITPYSPNRRLPLGVMSNRELTLSGKEFLDTRIQFQAGDYCLMFTDGLTEAVNYNESRMHPYQQQEEFGDQELCRSIQRFLKDSEPQDLIKNIVDDLELFRGIDQYDDDVCIISLKIETQQTPFTLESTVLDNKPE